jgi:hypothetical protein
MLFGSPENMNLFRTGVGEQSMVRYIMIEMYGVVLDLKMTYSRSRKLLLLLL